MKPEDITVFGLFCLYLWAIPRHNEVKKPLAKAIIKRFSSK
jgi:hypothetical protein